MHDATHLCLVSSKSDCLNMAAWSSFAICWVHQKFVQRVVAIKQDRRHVQSVKEAVLGRLHAGERKDGWQIVKRASEC